MAPNAGKVEVTFEVDTNGKLRVMAKNLNTNE